MNIGQGSPLVKINGFQVEGLPSGVSISGETDWCSTYDNQNNGTKDGRFVLNGENGGKIDETAGNDDNPICWGYDSNKNGNKSVKWVLDGIDGNQELLNKAADGEVAIGKVSVSVKAVYKQTFAIISDDGQMRFYKRVRVPSVEEEYDGVKVKHVYAGLDGLQVDKISGDWFGDTDAPWFDELSEPKSVKIMDSGIAFTNMAYMFQHMVNTEIIDLAKLEVPINPSNGLFHTFEGDTNLKSIVWPKSFKGLKCCSLDNTFAKCLNIEKIDLSTLDTTHVECITGTFFMCSSLNQIIGVNNICSTYTNRIEYCFQGCSSLEKLDLSQWNMSTVISYDKSCTGTPTSTKVKCATYYLFKDCYRLRELKLGSNFVFSDNHGNDIENDLYPAEPSPKYIDGADGYWYAASDGSKYKPVDIPSGKADTYYARATTSFAVYSDTDNSLDFYKRPGYPNAGESIDGKTVTNIWTGIEEGDWKISTDHSNTNTPWWNIRELIKHVNIVDKIKPKSIEAWFYYCVNIETIDLGDIDTSLCSSFYATFDRCFKLKSIDVSKLDTSNITNYGCMFWGDKLLTAIDISNFDLSKAYDLGWMFYRNSSLETIKLSVPKQLAATNYNCIFGACPKLILDCSSWNVNEKAMHDGFNYNSPGVSLPACWVPTAFVVYSSGDGSFNFYKREKYLIPDVGDTFNDKVVSKIYMGFETDCYTHDDKGWKNWTWNTPWWNEQSSIKSVNVIDNGIKPISMKGWFYNSLSLVSCDLSKMNLTACTDIDDMFLQSSVKTVKLSSLTSALKCMGDFASFCPSLTTIDISSSDFSSVTDAWHTFMSSPNLVLDCSQWNYTQNAHHDGFNSDSPNVILPSIWNDNDAANTIS